MVMDYSFFHADLHPGNIALSVELGTIVLYDFGSALEFPEVIRLQLDSIIKCIIQRDSTGLVDIFIELEIIIPTSTKEDIVLFFDSIINYLQKMDSKSLNNELVQDELISSLALEKPFILPSELIFLGKSLTLLEGICKQLDPQFNFFSVLEPYVTDNIMDSIDLQQMASSTLEMPSRIRSISTSVNTLEKQRRSIKRNFERVRTQLQITQVLLIILLLSSFF